MILKKRKMGKTKKKQSKKTSTTIFVIFTILFLFFTFAIFLLSLLRYNYQKWEEGFLESDVLFLEQDSDVEERVNRKILDYNRRTEEYSFIEFNKDESLFLLSTALTESFPNWLKMEDFALSTSSGRWILYFEGSVRDISLPWIGIILVKENVQSMDVHVEDVVLGNISFKSFSLGSVVEKINSGINTSMRLINDGNFAGKVFENIELAEESLTIKSRNISF